MSDEQFLAGDTSPVTGVEKLNTEAKEMAQKSLNNYVRLQGLTMSQVRLKRLPIRQSINMSSLQGLLYHM